MRMRTSVPLQFFNIFWVLVSPSFWDDQNKYGAKSSVSATESLWSWSLICANIFPSTPKNWQNKEMLPAFSSHGFGKKDSMLSMIFHACCFPSCPTSGVAAWCVNERSDWQSAACELLFHDCSAESPRSSEVLLHFLHSIHQLLPAALVCPSSAYLLPFILLSLFWLLSRFTPCRYLHVFVFARRLGSADSTLRHMLDP